MLAPEAQTVTAPGHGPPPLPFLILCWLHSLAAFLFLVGRWQPAALSNPSKKKKKERKEGRKVIPLLTGQAEVPRLSLSGPVGVSAHLCACHCGHRGVLAQWTEGGGRMFPKENVRSVSRKKRAWY